MKRMRRTTLWFVGDERNPPGTTIGSWGSVVWGDLSVVHNWSTQRP
jgi:hypothetical protein